MSGHKAVYPDWYDPTVEDQIRSMVEQWEKLFQERQEILQIGGKLQRVTRKLDELSMEIKLLHWRSRAYDFEDLSQIILWAEEARERRSRR